MRAPVVVRCADGRVTLQADQADALRRSGELQGRTRPRTWLTRGEVEALLIRRPEFSVCDFCATRGSSEWWDFPARDYDLPGAGRSVGNWRACAACTRLINAGDRVELAARGARLNDRPASAYRWIHDGFWSHREGAPRRVERKDDDAT